MSEAVQRTYRPGKAPLSSGPLSTSISTDTAKYRIATVLPLLGDPDPRVRTTAIETLICEHDRDSITANALQASVYCRAREAVSDDNEMVRAQAIELVRVLGHRFPEKSVPPIDVSKGKKSGPGEDESRLANDAFAVLCGGVMDLSVRVRAKAARALGSIAADEHILVQTFDKKVMSHLRKKRTEHETMHLQQRRTDTVAAFGDVDVDVDADSISLMSAGACGAFVHGLEDEFYEVRAASIESICALSAVSLPLANKALDFLTDMFNDEIDSVRLLAVQGIRGFAARVVFHQAQVDIMLGSLDDKSGTLRLAMHRLLAQVRVASSVSLHTIVSSLVSNLQRIGPGDNESVWRACRGLGINNARLCECLVDPLLHVGVHFTTPEPNVDDPAYVAVVVLIANAAASNANVTTLLPAFFPRHHRYLCDRYPALVPPLNLRASCTFVADLFYTPDALTVTPHAGTTLVSADESAKAVGELLEATAHAPVAKGTGASHRDAAETPGSTPETTDAGPSQRAEADLCAIVANLRQGLDMVTGTTHGLQVLRACHEQLRLHIRVHKRAWSCAAGAPRGNASRSGAAAVHVQFCSWAVQFWDTNALLDAGHQAMVLPLPPHYRLYHVEALHQHLDRTTRTTLRMLRALAHAQCIWSYCIAETESTRELVLLFVRRVDRCFVEDATLDGCDAPPATRACAMALRACQDQLKRALEAYTSGRAHRAQTVVSDAVRQLLVITLTVGLPRAVHVRAHVYNLTDIASLRVRTKYPSGQEFLTRPSTTHAHETSGTATVLECVVYISNDHVADLFEISLSLGVTYTPDVPNDPIDPGYERPSRKRKHPDVNEVPGLTPPSTTASFVAIAPPRKLHVKVTVPKRAP